MRHKKYLYKGIFRTAVEVAYIFGITPSAIRKRIDNGWKLKDENWIQPERQAGWKKDIQASSRTLKQLKGSFIGDSQTAENVYV